jgi:hypothetical protein
MIASLIILAAIGISGSCFIIGTLLRDDAADYLADKRVQQDWPHLPSANSSFHGEGRNR